MNVVISGLTAAGKTTHAKLLAGHLGYQYVSASAVLADLAGVDGDPSKNWWLDDGPTVSAKRRRDDLDRILDARMVDLVDGSSGQVFDAWALPWTSTSPMVRVWLESSPQSRYRKCKVSHFEQRDLTLQQCQEIVNAKDNESRAIFSELHRFDLFTDHDVFDIRLDLTEFIPNATPACAAAGIARADPMLTRLVREVLSSSR